MASSEMQPVAPHHQHSRPTEASLRRAYGEGNHVTPLVDPDDDPGLTKVQRVLKAAKGKVPLLTWGRTYGREDLKGDLISGLTVAVVLIPQAIAYALLVELPPVYGLYTSFVPLLVYPFLGTSRQMCIGPFALVSLVVANVVSGIVPTEPDVDLDAYVGAVLLVTVLTGLVQILMGTLGLGMISSFLAGSCISGFTTAVALIIIASQLKYFLGAAVPKASLPVTIYRGIEVVVTGRANGWAVLVTIGAFCIIMGLKNAGRRFCKKIPLFEQLVAVIFFTGLAAGVDLGVEVIGEIPAGLPVPTLPAFPSTLGEWGLYLQGSAVVAFTSFLVSMSIVKVFAAKHQYATDANQELVALGAANVVGGLFRAYPSSGSFSRTAIVSSLGGRTPLHGVVQAVVIALVLLVLTPLFETLPYAVLAAIIFAALQSLVDFSTAVKLWKSSRPDFFLWVIAFIATAIFDVQVGLIVSMIASLGLLVLRTSRPRTVVLGRLPGTDIYRDVRRYPSAQTLPHLLLFRFDSPLHFANADYFAASVRQRLRAMLKVFDDPTHFVLDCSSIHTIDSSAHDVFVDLVKELHKARVAVLLVSTRAPFRDALTRFGTYDNLIGENNMFLTLKDAVDVGCAVPMQPPVRREMNAVPSAVDGDHLSESGPGSVAGESPHLGPGPADPSIDHIGLDAEGDAPGGRGRRSTGNARSSGLAAVVVQRDHDDGMGDGDDARGVARA